jgi:hypothetical protein
MVDCRSGTSLGLVRRARNMLMCLEQITERMIALVQSMNEKHGPQQMAAARRDEIMEAAV